MRPGLPKTRKSTKQSDGEEAREQGGAQILQTFVQDVHKASTCLDVYNHQGLQMSTNARLCPKFTEKSLDVVLASRCCYNKLSQTVWLKTTHIYPLVVLGVRSPKSVSLG